MRIRKLVPIGLVTFGILLLAVAVKAQIVDISSSTFRGLTILLVGCIIVPIANRILSESRPKPRRQ